MKYNKKTYLALFVLIASGLIALSVNESSLAFARGGGGSRGGGGHSSGGGGGGKKSHHSSPGRPPGGHKDNNSYGQASLSGGCHKVAGYCVTFSKGGCGNFYIKGYHYGGSKACELLDRCGSSSNRRGGGGGGNRNNNSGPTVSFRGTNHLRSGNTTTSATDVTDESVTTVLTRSCTPGASGANACPEDSLGSVIISSYLNPSYANSKTNTCPLFWVAGTQTTNAKIICSIETNGVDTDVPTDLKKEGYPNGYPVKPGKHTLTCTRMLVNTLTDEDGNSYDEEVDTVQSAQFNCRPYPQIREI